MREDMLWRRMMYGGDVIESKDRVGDIIMRRIWYGGYVGYGVSSVCLKTLEVMPHR